MSKTSYTLIIIMLAALAYMGALRGYQLYERKTAQWEEERQAAQGPFSFQQVPISLAAPQAEPTARPVVYKEGANADIFLEDKPLPTELQTKQAQDTIVSILDDFKDEPSVRSFNKDLAQATQGQAVDLSALGGGDLAQVLRDNPQIRQVVSKHMQDPEFAQKVQQIFSNPQFVESVRHLQQQGAPVSTRGNGK
ncbi:MAG: hypothetical protein IKP06_01405 [Elusimicrobiaceae bacterium]|nr:hypothetical protein [Elusimicrobiaceae bacterium]